MVAPAVEVERKTEAVAGIPIEQEPGGDVVELAEPVLPAGARIGHAKRLEFGRHAAVDPRIALLPFISVHRLERSEEHTSELQSLMRISYAVFCLKKKKKTTLHKQK